MARREMRIEGDPILRKAARPVKVVNDKIRTYLADMLDTMYEQNGVGLAGPQVGLLRRLVVIDVGDGPMQCVNPEIVERSEEECVDVEGCLSIPGFNGTVRRPLRVRARYLDEMGESREVAAEGLLARCLCHEIDHLDGVLFRDRVDRVLDMEHLSEEDIAYLRDVGALAYASDAEESNDEKDGVQGKPEEEQG
nr:peptide deformylase [Ndongobacter massiliensis]